VRRTFCTDLQTVSVALSPAVQISVSTADESENYFTGHSENSPEAEPSALLPSGTYRIVDGQLFQIVESPLRESSKKKLA
jgi:hypothetical protein